MEQERSLEEMIAEQEAAERRTWYDWAESAIIALVIAALVTMLAFRVVGVSGNSMLSTLQHGDGLLMVSGFYDEPTYGDIVVVKRDNAEPLIKRVIALPGDVVAIDAETETVYLNGEKLDEPYITGTTPTLYGFTGPYTVPVDSVFVLGDNRKDSHDSRDLGGIGAVHEDDIMGKAVFRVWPPATFGKIG